jgi:rubrerythrin
VAKLEEESLAALDPVARKAAQHVIDLDAAENDCPACGRRFAGHPARCPGCGLRIG